MPAPIRLDGLDDVRAMLRALPGSTLLAGEKAQNRMVYEIRAGEQEQMRADLDRPTAWTVGSLVYKKVGAPGAREPGIQGAAVYMLDKFNASDLVDPETWVGVQIEGGATAGPRGSELALIGMGVMRSGDVWVPDPSVKLNAYGNVNGSVINSMLADLRAGDPWRRDPTRNFMPLGKPARGILAKVGDSWYPFLWFVSRRTTYQKKFKFYARAFTEINDKFADILSEEIRRAWGEL